MDALKGARSSKGEGSFIDLKEWRGKAFLGAISSRKMAVGARLHFNTVMATGDLAWLVEPLFITSGYLPSRSYILGSLLSSSTSYIFDHHRPCLFLPFLSFLGLFTLVRRTVNSSYFLLRTLPPPTLIPCSIAILVLLAFISTRKIATRYTPTSVSVLKTLHLCSISHFLQLFLSHIYTRTTAHSFYFVTFDPIAVQSPTKYTSHLTPSPPSSLFPSL